jgi:hypothetical protein
MDLVFQGKVLPTSILTVREGEKATITHLNDNRRNFIDVTTTKSTVAGHPGILMKFNIGTRAENGKKTILASPQIIANDDSVSKITQGDKGKEIISLSVVAKTIK